MPGGIQCQGRGVIECREGFRDRGFIVSGGISCQRVYSGERYLILQNPITITAVCIVITKYCN